MIIGFAFLATVINYLSRQTLSVIAPTLKEQWGITDSQYGLIISAFLLAYALANGVSGVIIDRVGSKIGYALFVLWWSVSGILHAAARGPWSFGACRFLLGMGEAGNWPAAVKVISEWFRPEERTLAAGIFNSGSSRGGVIAPPLVAWLAIRGGWRSAFAVTGGLGLVWVAAWSAIYRSPSSAGPKRRTVPPISDKRLKRTRFMVFFTLSKVCVDPVWYFYIFWIPKYLSNVFGFTLADIGRTAWIPFVTADVGNLAGGALTGWLIRRRWPIPVARKTGAAIFGLLMTAGIPAIFATRPVWAIGWVSLATFGYTGYLANTLAFPADVFPQGAVGSVWGLASMGSGFGGMLLRGCRAG